MGEALRQCSGTAIDFGWEFGPVDQLKSVMGNHPSFEYCSKIFQEGMSSNLLSKLNEDQWMTELMAQLGQEIHYLATQILAKEVQHGFAIPIFPVIIPRLKGGMVQPCSVIEQFSLDFNGVAKN